MVNSAGFLRRVTRTVLLAGGLTFALAACSTGAEAEPTTATADSSLGHVHGLGVDTSTGSTFAATHNGVWLLPTAALPASYPARDTDALTRPTQIAGRAQDTMGFVAVQPGLLLGSGHPDPAEQPATDPANLGLLSSTDGANTWESVSLRGETDFHDLDATMLPGGELRIYGYDATTGIVKISSDSGATWENGANLQARDLALDPTVPDRLYATTAEGLFVSDDAGQTFEALPGAPALYLVAVTSDSGQPFGVDTDGTIWTSDGTIWTPHGSAAGTPQALAFVGGDAPWILLADDRGLIASNDYAVTATVLVAGTE